MPFKDDSARKKAFSNSFDSFTDRTKDTFSVQQNNEKNSFFDYDSFKDMHKNSDTPYTGGQGYTSYLDDVDRFTGSSNVEFHEQNVDIRNNMNYQIGGNDSDKYVDRSAVSNHINEQKSISSDYSSTTHSDFTRDTAVTFHEQHIQIQNDLGYEIKSNYFNQDNNGSTDFTSTNRFTNPEIGKFHNQNVEIQNSLGYEIKDSQPYYDKNAAYKHINNVVQDNPSINPKGYSYNPYRNMQGYSDVKSHDEIAKDVLSDFSSTDKFINPDSGKFVDRSFDTFTDKGGGAVLHHEVNEKGLIQTQIQLKRGKERTDKKTFSKRSFDFIDKTERAFEVAKPESNESAISNVDDKLIIAGNIMKDHFRDDRDRYHDIYKGRKKILKQIDKLEHELKGKERFNKSESKFKDQNDAFYNKFENTFRTPGTDRLGNSYFLPTEQQRIMAVSATMGFDKNSSDSFKAQAYNIRSSYSTYIDSKFSDGKTGSAEYIADNLAVDDKFSSVKDVLQEKGLSGSVGKFEDSSLYESGNSSSRSVSSYFTDENGNKDARKQNLGNKNNRDNNRKDNNNENSKSNDKSTIKSDKSEAKQKEKKAKKRMAAVASVQNMLRAKKNMQNSLADFSGESSGDLMHDGMSGGLRALVEGIKAAIKELIRKIMIQVGAALAPLMAVIGFFLVLMFMFYFLIVLFSGSATDQDLEIPEGDGYTFDYLEEEEIDAIIEELYASYEMSPEKEALLRYALTKVGCSYDQGYHFSLEVDIFDCSSLVYRSYREIGIDISNHGSYSAAEEARYADNNSFVAYGELQPGDLIFYGGSNNGRYNGIYHVGMYVGNGKMVEARGKKYGVVYTDVRTSNVVSYGRYL